MLTFKLSCLLYYITMINESDAEKIDDIVDRFDNDVKINSKEFFKRFMMISNTISFYTVALNSPMRDMNAIANFSMGKIGEQVVEMQKLIGMFNYFENKMNEKIKSEKENANRFTG